MCLLSKSGIALAFLDIGKAPIKNNNYQNRWEEDALQYRFIGWVEEGSDKHLMFEAN